MAQAINFNNVNVPVTQPGVPLVYEIDTPSRKSGALITVDRNAWPEGALFDLRIYLAERGGEYRFITGSNESGGAASPRNGVQNPPLVIRLEWPLDKDRERLKFEIDVHQPFSCGLHLVWF